MVEWIFIATDTAFKGFEWDDSTKKFGRMEAAKLENIPTTELSQYIPLCLFYKVGTTDEINRRIKSITKVKKTYEVAGFIAKGRPFPMTWNYAVGESFLYSSLFGADGKELAHPIIQEIITTEEGVINYVQALESKMNRNIKAAEQTYAAEQTLMESESYGMAMESLAEELSQPAWLRKP
jgi:hypothetical protein